MMKMQKFEEIVASIENTLAKAGVQMRLVNGPYISDSGREVNLVHGGEVGGGLIKVIQGLSPVISYVPWLTFQEMQLDKIYPLSRLPEDAGLPNIFTPREEFYPGLTVTFTMPDGREADFDVSPDGITQSCSNFSDNYQEALRQILKLQL